MPRNLERNGIEGGKTITVNVALGDMPLFVRAGAVIPFGRVKQYTSEPVDEPITLRVYPGKDGHFTWYDDDGISYAHERGEFVRTACSWDDSSRTLTISRDASGRLPLPSEIQVEMIGSSERREVKLSTNGGMVKF